MTETLTTALDRAAEPVAQVTIRDLIARMRPELEASLRSPEAAGMLMRHYLTAIRLTPQLLGCTSESLLAGLLLSAQVRLEPGPLGHVYLVPYKTECVWILGYTGILELARRSERVGALRARVVWDVDEYAYSEDERGEHFTFKPGDEDMRAARRLVVVAWKERVGGTWLPRAVEVPRSRIERAKAASPALKAKSGPWITDESAMWAKTGIRAVRPWLPLTAEAAYGASMDDAIVVGLTTDEMGAAQPDVIEAEA
jgi:recombination protein RecT